MTTIVYDHERKQIAIDSRTTGDGIIQCDTTIKYKYSGGSILFLCGYVSDHQALIDCFNGAEAKEKEGSHAISVVNGQVKICGIDGGQYWILDLEYSTALGSGSKFALSALDFGKTAKESAEYASTRDLNNGGKVHVYDIESAKFL